MYHPNQAPLYQIQLFQPGNNTERPSSVQSPAFWLKLILKCVPCVLTAERDARYVGHVRTFVADLESLTRDARMGVADREVISLHINKLDQIRKLPVIITIPSGLDERTDRGAATRRIRLRPVPPVPPPRQHGRAGGRQ